MGPAVLLGDHRQYRDADLRPRGRREPEIRDSGRRDHRRIDGRGYKAYKELQGGELFRNVAMAYSIDETTRRSLAETDLLSKGEQPELDAVGFSLRQVGDVSEPFETARGWMILKLTEKQDSRKYTIDEARDSIRGALKQQKIPCRVS